MVGKPDVEMGVTTVGFVAPDSPAAQSGILPGDRIVKVDGRPVDKWAGNMEGVRELIMLGEHDQVVLRCRGLGMKERWKFPAGSGFRKRPGGSAPACAR